MNAKPPRSALGWVDPDDAPEWTEDQLDRAEYAIDGQIVRPAQATLARGPGRPRIANPKQPVSVRLDRDVLAALRAEGPGWQARMNQVLRKALGFG